MSFQCSRCLEVQGSYARPTKVVTETRTREYMGAYAGWEIKKEEDLCESCASEVPDRGEEMRILMGPNIDVLPDGTEVPGLKHAALNGLKQSDAGA